ncbi:MAG: ATPase, T2SS/T4P/T4SS family [Robiginitomaculum sp.]|nr:ATPase, T2SS/T4P/T4SS family [Robiginitomaculum sp.]
MVKAWSSACWKTAIPRSICIILALAKKDETRLLKTLAAPFGLILVVGPTGGGKTTTLAGAISTLNTPERKVISIEDPVEYQIDGVTQIAVRPAIGLTFANALRSVLRQDPDVIVVGELRDQETAEIAVNAALTGHLVLATLHANTAAGAPARLIDMGIDPSLLRSTLRLILSQRLIRLLCKKCKRKSKANGPPWDARLALAPAISGAPAFTRASS